VLDDGYFRRRMIMFESMIDSILYGAEIWGWKEQEEVGIENAGKIFERGARCGQRNARLHSEERGTG
jgi:hypothetical protein